MEDDRIHIISVLIVNTIILIMALIEKWRFFDVALVYLIQMWVILIFGFIHILLGEDENTLSRKLFSILKLFLLYGFMTIVIYGIIFNDAYIQMILGKYIPQGLTIALITIVIQNLIIFIYDRIKKVNYTTLDVALITYGRILSISLGIIIFGYIFLIYSNDIINIIGISVFICLKSLNDVFINTVMRRIYPPS